MLIRRLRDGRLQSMCCDQVIVGLKYAPQQGAVSLLRSFQVVLGSAQLAKQEQAPLSLARKAFGKPLLRRGVCPPHRHRRLPPGDRAAPRVSTWPDCASPLDTAGTSSSDNSLPGV